MNVYMDDRKLGGAVLLDFTAVFDVIGRNFLSSCLGEVTFLAEHRKCFSVTVFLTAKTYHEVFHK